MNGKDVAIVAKITSFALIVAALCDIFRVGWNWGVFDYIFALVMFFSAGLGIRYVVTHATSSTIRVLGILFILAIFALVWSEMAVDAVSEALSNFF